MIKRLTPDQIKYIVKQCAKKKSTVTIAKEMHISQRHVQRLWAEFKKTGIPHVPLVARRKPVHPTRPQIDAVLKEHEKKPKGVGHMTGLLKEQEHDISYNLTYKIMKENRLVTPSAAKSKKRKWVRFERRYSDDVACRLAYHEAARFKGFNLVTYLDDSSRCIMASRLFIQATSENAVVTLKEAISKFETPATILSDNGACFVGQNGRKKKIPNKTWKPTIFEAELLDRGIELINSRPYHPQTNGKLERFHRSIEEEIEYFESLSKYIKYYNEERLHFSLDIDRYERPLGAFYSRQATNAIRKSNPKWMEMDIND